MMETMRDTPHGNSISSFSTSPLPSQTRLEQRSQVRGDRIIIRFQIRIHECCTIKQNNCVLVNCIMIYMGIGDNLQW